MTYTAGVDEAGRGPWAGPVAVAAVILDENNQIAGLNDSKKLSAITRDRLYDLIIANALSYSITFVEVVTIDKINIREATLLGMQRVIKSLDLSPDLVLVDGKDAPPMPCKVEAIIKGDAKVAAIAAASILAKVTRDRFMVELAKTYPLYGFAQHKGYGTKQHQEALDKYGVTVHHRKSFAPIRKLLQNNLQDLTVER
tara:strand:- start:2331 stop:2924 length:594 start_codon:yes stop_codon:yes gene_type:complete